MLPKSLTVLGERWSVKCIRNLTYDDTSCWGLTDFDTRVISIESSQSDAAKWQVLFHELIHVVLGTTATNGLIIGEGAVRQDNEEIIVRALEYSLWPVIKNLVKKGAR